MSDTPEVAVSVEIEDEKLKEKPRGAEKAEAKAERDEVDFGRGTSDEACAYCSHYTWAPYDRGVYDGSCAKVKGAVAPGDWCKIFSREEEAEEKNS